MFKVKKNIAAFLVSIMLLTQIGIAQHNVIHLADHVSYNSAHDHHDHDHDNQTHSQNLCEICLVSQSFSFGLVSDYRSVLFGVVTKEIFVPHSERVATKTKNLTYNPRAPPHFLI